MCLGIPGKIVEIRSHEPLRLGIVDFTAGGVCPSWGGPNPGDGADGQTCTVPSSKPSIADWPAGATECAGRNPSAWRNPPANVAINGE